MATSSTNVRSAITGEVYVGPTTSDVPTGTGGTLDTDFIGLGYLNEDGVEISPERETKELPAWQNGDIVRSINTSSKLTLKFVMIETKKEVVETYFQAAVTAAASDGSVLVNPGATLGRKSYVLDVVDGAELIRYYIPSAEVTEREPITNVNGELIGYGVTLLCYPTLVGAETFAAKAWMTALKTGTASVPLIYSILPAGAAVGAQVTITGRYFTGMTAISMDSQTVVIKTVVADDKIVMIVPAAVAGAASTTVTNATGASAAYSYTAA